MALLPGNQAVVTLHGDYTLLPGNLAVVTLDGKHVLMPGNQVVTLHGKLPGNQGAAILHVECTLLPGNQVADRSHKVCHHTELVDLEHDAVEEDFVSGYHFLEDKLWSDY